MANGNPWFTAAQQTLPEHVPVPMQELFQAGQALQNRFDTNMSNIDAVGTGLASIEARLPGHRDYVSKLANNYRQESSDLLDKFGGNAADPQFQREFSRLRSKYANDRNLSTILMANESAKRNEELAARMAAEGRLFVNPRGTGVDAQGNIVNDVGQIRGVNTLDNWSNRFKIAAGTTSEVGNIITNRPALEKAQKEIAQSLAMGSPEFMDLKQAYIDRGMSSDEADNQIIQDVQRMSGEYAVSEKTNIPKLTYEEGVRARREAAALRRAEISAKGGSDAFNQTPPRFRAGITEVPGTTPGVSGIITNIVEDVGNTAINVPMYGNGVSFGQTGSQVSVAKGTSVKGRIHEIHDGKLNNTYRNRNSFKFDEENAVSLGFEAPFVITTGKNAGKILSKDESNLGFGNKDGSSSSIDIKKDSRGYYVEDKDGIQRVEPRAMERYQSGRYTVWRELNHDQTVQFLGPEYGYLSGERPSVTDRDRGSNEYLMLAQSMMSTNPNVKVEDIDAKYQEAKDEYLFRLQESTRGNPSTEPSDVSRLRGGR